MKINKEEASIILKIMGIAWDEGLGADDDWRLVKRIIKEYPSIEVPYLVDWFITRDHPN